jgi:GT2 family glycosyltransferase
MPDAVVVLDNASTDDGLAVARRTEPGIQAIRSSRNVGFARGHNWAMAAAPADLHILLNPDARLAPGFLERAVATMDEDPRAGSLSGRLLRFRADDPNGRELSEFADDVVDSTGMVACRNRRVLDRGTNESASGRYQDPSYVFGASGAAGVYRRAMLEDVAFQGQYFDETFFAYREDVDLAWRAQLLGWRCRYEPTALVRHRRLVAPGRRRHLPPRINRLSLANRWRMIAKNETGAGWRHDWPWIMGRDAGVLAYCGLREQLSLLAVLDAATDAPHLRAWRQDIMRRRRVNDHYMLGWFGRIAELPLNGLRTPMGGS